MNLTLEVAGDTSLKAGYPLDYGPIAVKDFSQISGFGYLSPAVRKPTAGEKISISGYPAGRPQALSPVSDGNYCTVFSANGRGTRTDARYNGDTEGGNSGSPIWARASNKVIAAHHRINRGVWTARIDNDVLAEPRSRRIAR